MLSATVPADAVGAPSGQPTVLVVRTAHGWTVLSADPAAGWVDAAGEREGAPELTLVEAMSLADLVAAESGVAAEPDREARRAARNTAAPAQPPADDPRDDEIAALRRTVGQLEHALAARVSIERAMGVLAERHGVSPREAFEELRRRARSQGRPAHELAAEVLDGLPATGTRPGQRAAHTGAGPLPTLVPALEPRPSGGSTTRRVQRGPRRGAGGGGAVPEARR